MRFVPLILLSLACAYPTPRDSSAELWELGDGPGAAVPITLSLVLTDSFEPGVTAHFDVYGLLGGEDVWLLFGDTAGALCSPVIGGDCLDVGGPLVHMTSGRADPAGTARFAVPVPGHLAEIDVEAQAVAVRGPGGASSVGSEAVGLSFDGYGYRPYDLTRTPTWCDMSSPDREIFTAVDVRILDSDDPHISIEVDWEKCDGSAFVSTKDCHVRVGTWEPWGVERLAFVWPAGSDHETTRFDVWVEAGGIDDPYATDIKEFWLTCDDGVAEAWWVSAHGEPVTFERR